VYSSGQKEKLVGEREATAWWPTFSILFVQSVGVGLSEALKFNAFGDDDVTLWC